MSKTPFPTCKIFANHLLFVNYKRGILFLLLETPYLPSSTLICLRIVPSLIRFLLSYLKVRKFKDMCLDYSFYELVGTDNEKLECGDSHTCER